MNVMLLFGFCCAGIIVLAFWGGGAFLIYRTRQSGLQADASQSWPSTTGQVTETSISHHTQMAAEGDSQDTYSPEVRFAYQVAGQSYQGSKLSFGFQQTSSNRSAAEAILTRYPVGAQVTVYFEPTNPQNAVLERKAGGSTTGYVIGGILILVGFCIICPTLIVILNILFGSGS